LFDLEIYGLFFDGQDWVVPNPEKTFRKITELPKSTENLICQGYIVGIVKEAEKKVANVADEIMNSACTKTPQFVWGFSESEYRDAIKRIDDEVGNVFSKKAEPDGWTTSGPYIQALYQDRLMVPFDLPYGVKCVLFVLSIRLRLVLNVISQLEEKGFGRFLPPGPAFFVHNYIIAHNVSRYIKTIERGIVIDSDELHGLDLSEHYDVLRHFSHPLDYNDGGPDQLDDMWEMWLNGYSEMGLARIALPSL